MNKEDNILGCFVSGGSAHFEDDQKTKDLAVEQSKVFRSYIWDKKGISDILKQIKQADYGQDLKLILFQFYVKPISYELQGLKEIENYRKSEKAIGIPIIITDENFFNKSEDGRFLFLKQTVLQKLDLVAEMVKKKKLDTDIRLLIVDLNKIFESML